MAWIFLIIAGAFEVVWALSMKQSDGFTKLLPSLITAVAMLISIVFLSLSMRVLPLGTAYAMWTGIGAVGAFIAGVWLLGESASVLRIVAASLIFAGLIMMKLSSAD